MFGTAKSQFDDADEDIVPRIAALEVKSNANCLRNDAIEQKDSDVKTVPLIITETNVLNVKNDSVDYDYEDENDYNYDDDSDYDDEDDFIIAHNNKTQLPIT